MAVCRATAMSLVAWAALSLMASTAAAEDMKLSIEIPRLDVAEYHKPYLAVWLASEDQTAIADLALWYDLKMADKEGEKWLKDMRQWWRRSGRSRTMPIDGVSGATRAPGVHQLAIAADKPPFSTLPHGRYLINVEAAREVGGRELLQIPIEWPLKKSDAAITASGESELGIVELHPAAP